MRILIIATEGVNDFELLYPHQRLKEEGHEIVIASDLPSFRGKYGMGFKADALLDEVDPESFDVLVIPGGKSPERLRLDPKALEIAKHFFEKGKPVAAICHGPQILISAGLLRGRRLTSWKGIKDDVIAAGGRWEDREVVVDGNLVTSRHPWDLWAWMREFVRILRS